MDHKNIQHTSYTEQTQTEKQRDLRLIPDLKEFRGITPQLILSIK